MNLFKGGDCSKIPFLCLSVIERNILRGREKYLSQIKNVLEFSAKCGADLKKQKTKIKTKIKTKNKK